MGIPICVRLAALMGGSLELGDRVDGPGARCALQERVSLAAGRAAFHPLGL
jgi:hypothetical protein